MAKKFSIMIVSTLVIALLVSGCSSTANKGKDTKEEAFKQVSALYDEKKYSDAISKYAEYISLGGDEKFSKLDELMINFIKDKYSKGKNWTSIQEMNKDGYAFGDLDNDKIPEIYKLDVKSNDDNKASIKIYKYEKDQYKDVSSKYAPSNRIFPGELSVSKINENTYGLISNAMVLKDSNIDVYIMDKEKLSRLINSTVAGMNKFAQDIDGDGILEIPQLNNSDKLSWYKFDKDLKVSVVKEEKIKVASEVKVQEKPKADDSTKKPTEVKNNSISNDIKAPKDEDILNLFSVGRNFEASRLLEDGDSSQTVSPDGISYAIMKNQSVNIDNETKAFSQYFSKDFINSHVKNFFKVIDSKKYVLCGDGLNTLEKFTRVISSTEDGNKINARIEYVDADVTDVCNVELVYEDNSWKINDGSLLIK
ncbi:DL-endopeptidase inhibitor IseA family protein [Clostridium sp. C8-1-8]|uniref:DL-endopeptidase inhibitor IseA family protein n=1 Tax=Clostridium sp. C8-1-8 TaxID=2698831 RepID=UPI00136F4CD9|nr:DL-endopeptidase inhibitor IseA family protein [Clostridium sp. C8-1-8]